MNVNSVSSLFQEKSPSNVPSFPLNRKLDSTLLASIGWLKVSLISGSRGNNCSADGSNVTTRGRDVVNIQVFWSLASSGKPTPVTVSKVWSRVTMYSVPPTMDLSG